MKRALVLVCILLPSCAGFNRGCDSTMAESFGADWVVVQFDQLGRPFNCWKLHETSITNEAASDGIYWAQDGNLVHISGWYNRVQVSRDWGAAAVSLGINLKACVGGAYHAPESQPTAPE